MSTSPAGPDPDGQRHSCRSSCGRQEHGVRGEPAARPLQPQRPRGRAQGIGHILALLSRRTARRVWTTRFGARSRGERGSRGVQSQVQASSSRLRWNTRGVPGVGGGSSRHHTSRLSRCASNRWCTTGRGHRLTDIGDAVRSSQLLGQHATNGRYPTPGQDGGSPWPATLRPCSRRTEGRTVQNVVDRSRMGGRAGGRCGHHVRVGARRRQSGCEQPVVTHAGHDRRAQRSARESGSQSHMGSLQDSRGNRRRMARCRPRSAP